MKHLPPYQESHYTSLSSNVGDFYTKINHLFGLSCFDGGILHCLISRDKLITLPIRKSKWIYEIPPQIPPSASAPVSSHDEQCIEHYH